MLLADGAATAEVFDPTHGDMAMEIETVGSARDVLENALDASGQGALFDTEPATDLESVAAEIAAWESEGMRLVTILDDDYPLCPRLVHQRPPFLFLRGTPVSDDPAPRSSSLALRLQRASHTLVPSREGCQAALSWPLAWAVGKRAAKRGKRSSREGVQRLTSEFRRCPVAEQLIAANNPGAKYIEERYLKYDLSRAAVIETGPPSVTGTEEQDKTRTPQTTTSGEAGHGGQNANGSSGTTPGSGTQPRRAGVAATSGSA